MPLYASCSMVTTRTLMRSSWAEPTMYSCLPWHALVRIIKMMVAGARPFLRRFDARDALELRNAHHVLVSGLQHDDRDDLDELEPGEAHHVLTSGVQLHRVELSRVLSPTHLSRPLLPCTALWPWFQMHV